MFWFVIPLSSRNVIGFCQTKVENNLVPKPKTNPFSPYYRYIKPKNRLHKHFKISTRKIKPIISHTNLLSQSSTFTFFPPPSLQLPSSPLTHTHTHTTEKANSKPHPTPQPTFTSPTNRQLQRSAMFLRHYRSLHHLAELAGNVLPWRCTRTGPDRSLARYTHTHFVTCRYYR